MVSPEVTRLRPEHDVAASVRHLGFGVVRGAFTDIEVSAARRAVLDNLGLLKNTRPTTSSRHLAGFHRFPELEPLHLMLTGHREVVEHIARLTGRRPRTIGLSDITVNRSQSWHKDLLRGPFRDYMDDTTTCRDHHGKVFKVILYLQESASLQVVPGSHREDVSLLSDDAAVPPPEREVIRVTVGVGDAVIVDVCTTHRGADEDACSTPASEANPRMLISTVFGGVGCEFTDRMEAGNLARLQQWSRRHP